MKDYIGREGQNRCKTTCSDIIWANLKPGTKLGDGPDPAFWQMKIPIEQLPHTRTVLEKAKKNVTLFSEVR